MDDKRAALVELCYYVHGRNLIDIRRCKARYKLARLRTIKRGMSHYAEKEHVPAKWWKLGMGALQRELLETEFQYVKAKLETSDHTRATSSKVRRLAKAADVTLEYKWGGRVHWLRPRDPKARWLQDGTSFDQAKIKAYHDMYVADLEVAKMLGGK